MKEFVDFLGAHPPYDRLSPEDLATLAREVDVEFFPSGTTIVVADGEAPLTHLYVVRAGAVEIIDRGRVVDLLGEGDTFGHVSVLSGLPPALGVRAAEDTVAYRLPNPRTVLGDVSLRFTHYGSLISRERLTRTSTLEAARRPVGRYVRPIVWGDATTTVQEAAQRIDEAGQSSMLVRTPSGLSMVTDRDFRRFLASGTSDASRPIGTIATRPVRTVPATTSVSAAYLQMIEHGVHHLVVTGDDRPVGVVRVVDLASADVRDPLLVRAAVDDATSALDLARAASLLPATAIELDANGIPATRIAALLSTVVDVILQRIIALESKRCGESYPDASWMVLGSRARREPLPSSDVDTALAWTDLAVADPSGRLRAFAERVLSTMEACGFRRCPDGANATNPLFSRSSSDWASATSLWIRDPTRDGALLLASMVTDSRPVTAIAVGRGVIGGMLSATHDDAFLAALLRLTLSNRPPTGFVRDFVVEHTGEHRGQLDLKRGGLLPLASLGRWMAVAVRDGSGSTPDRLRNGHAAGLLSANESDALVGAFEEVFSLLFARDIEAIRSGRRVDRHIAPKELDPLTRRFLRETFREIAHIQGVVQSEWVSRRSVRR